MKKSSPIILAIIFMIAVVNVWLWFWVGLDYFINDENSRGTFGDKFGAINSLFSGLAFAGLIYAILLQREELSLTREELSGQRMEFEEQNRTLRRQQFDNAFFQMLSLHNEIVNSLQANTLRGRSVFERILAQINQHVGSVVSKQGTEKSVALNDGYEMFYNQNQNSLSHYYRNLYRICEFVYSSEVDNKQFYFDLLKAQLSTQELALIFYECMAARAEKLKAYVEMFGFFRSLNKDQIIFYDYFSPQYDGKAFL
ncbi:MAG: putative phage abortive infection protein [Micavibrio sp.]